MTPTSARIRERRRPAAEREELRFEEGPEMREYGMAAGGEDDRRRDLEAELRQRPEFQPIVDQSADERDEHRGQQRPQFRGIARDADGHKERTPHGDPADERDLPSVQLAPAGRIDESQRRRDPHERGNRGRGDCDRQEKAECVTHGRSQP